MSSYADDMKKEIEILTKKLADLDVLRIERDNIARQKAEMEKEIQGHKGTLMILKEDILKFKDRKATEEAKRNAELDEKQNKINENVAAIMETSDHQAKTALKHEAKEHELASREAKIEAREVSMANRENEQSAKEKAHQEAIVAFSKKVSAHGEAVNAFETSKKAINDRELSISGREMQVTADRNAVDSEWKLVHKAHAELDQRKSVIETAETSLVSAKENVKQVVEGVIARDSKLDQREKDLEAREREVVARQESSKKTADDLTLRELECQGKERALDKRERIIVLKEQANGGK